MHGSSLSRWIKLFPQNSDLELPLLAIGSDESSSATDYDAIDGESDDEKTIQR